MTDHGKLVSAEAYRAVYDPTAGFEGVCSLARQRRNLAFLAEHRPAHILEVGCGGLLLLDLARQAGLDFALWSVVEPVADFAAAAEARAAADPRIRVRRGYLEAETAALDALCPGGYDAVILSGLLHETAEPAALLRAALALAAPGGRVLASVPNARSFHRLLAVHAGLIPDPATLSARDRALGHSVVFDRAGFTRLMAEAELIDLTFDGYLFKPFTHAQMERILAPGDAALIDGLIALGAEFPDQAAEICITGRKPG